MKTLVPPVLPTWEGDARAWIRYTRALFPCSGAVSPWEGLRTIPPRAVSASADLCMSRVPAVGLGLDPGGQPRTRGPLGPAEESDEPKGCSLTPCRRML